MLFHERVVLPCLPENETGSYINFLSKNKTAAYFRGISFISINQNQNCKVEIKRFLNTQNMKTDIHSLINNTFYLKTAVHRLNSGVIFMLSPVIELFPLPHLLN